MVGDLAVAEDGDQVVRREVRGLRAGDVHRVEVLVGAVLGTAAGGALLVGRELGGRPGTVGVDPWVLRVVTDVELAVAVEVVTAEILAVPSLRVRELARIQVDRVETVLDPVRAVVDAALDVGDQDVVPADVALGPGPGHVDPRGAFGVGGVAGPAGEAAVRARLIKDGTAGGEAEAVHRAVEVPLFAVLAAGDRVLDLAAGEVRVVRPVGLVQYRSGGQIGCRIGGCGGDSDQHDGRDSGKHDKDAIHEQDISSLEAHFPGQLTSRA